VHERKSLSLVSMPFREICLMVARDLLGNSSLGQLTGTGGIGPDRQLAALLCTHRQRQLLIAGNSLIARIQLQQRQRQCLQWMTTLLSLPLGHLKAKSPLGPNLAAVRHQIQIEVLQREMGQRLVHSPEHRQEVQIWIIATSKTTPTLS